MGVLSLVHHRDAARRRRAVGAHRRAARRRSPDGVAERRRQEATLRTSYERIRHLAGRLINAQEAARAGIAQDLHDDVCQRLVFVSMAVSGLKNASGDIQAAGTQQAFAKLEQDTNGMFDRLRLLSHDLHPATLRVLGLTPALKAHCVEVEKRHDVHVSFRTEGDLGRLHPDVALCFFRIAQESLRNGVVHGRARHLEVSLARSGEHVELTVTDDGADSTSTRRSRNGSGLGLVSMEERAHLVGGGRAHRQRTRARNHGSCSRVRRTSAANPPSRARRTCRRDTGRPCSRRGLSQARHCRRSPDRPDLVKR